MRTRPTKKQLRPDDGNRFLYVVVAEHGGDCWMKVGVSSEIVGRMQSIQCGCPIPISRIHYAQVPEVSMIPKWAEAAVHARFQEHRSAGEWFHMQCSEDVLAKITEICARFAPGMEWASMERTCMVRDKREQVGRYAARMAEKLAERIEAESAPGLRDPIRMADISLADSMSCYKS